MCRLSPELCRSHRARILIVCPNSHWGHAFPQSFCALLLAVVAMKSMCGEWVSTGLPSSAAIYSTTESEAFTSIRLIARLRHERSMPHWGGKIRAGSIHSEAHDYADSSQRFATAVIHHLSSAGGSPGAMMSHRHRARGL